MPEMEIRIVEHPAADGPYGAKGIGELPSIPTAPAICNAIYRATGVRAYQLPVRSVPLQDSAEWTMGRNHVNHKWPCRHLWCGKTIIEDGAVRIEGDRITDVGDAGTLQVAYPDDEVVDAGGQLIMPGNICAHTHFYGAFSREWPSPAIRPDFEILGKLWWRLDRVLLAEDVRYSALVCLIDAIKHGTTTLIDHHASPASVAGSLDQIAAAVEQAGVRASLCYEVTDRNGPEETQAGIAENIRFLRAVRSPATRCWPLLLACTPR